MRGAWLWRATITTTRIHTNANAEDNIRFECTLSFAFSIDAGSERACACACRLKYILYILCRSWGSFSFFFFHSFFQFILRSIAHCTNCSITDKCIFLENKKYSYMLVVPTNYMYISLASSMQRFKKFIEMKEVKNVFFPASCFLSLQCPEDEHKCHGEGMHNKSVSVCFVDCIAASMSECPMIRIEPAIVSACQRHCMVMFLSRMLCVPCIFLRVAAQSAMLGALILAIQQRASTQNATCAIQN